jgi:hypothetical protein
MPTTDNYMRRQKILYQFADGFSNYFVFPKVELGINTDNSLKTNYENNRLTDGLINLSVDQKFRKGSYIYTVTFLLDNKDFFDIDYIKSVFWNGYRQIGFFYDLDIDSNMTFYYNYLTVTNSFTEDYKTKEEYNQSVIKLTVELTAENPFLFACDSNLAYFNKSAFVSNQRKWDEGLWDVGVWDPGIALSTISISGLTLQEKLDLFYNCKNNDNALVYTDRFFNPISYSLGGNLVIDQSLTVNTPIDIQTTSFLADSTADNRTFIIELSTMSLGDTVQITNITNKSGLMFTWLSAVNSPSLFYYNSVKNRCYQANGTIIPASDIQIVQQSNAFLYFNPKRTLNAVISTFNDSIRLQKNSSLTITVKIEALKTYH